MANYDGPLMPPPTIGQFRDTAGWETTNHFVPYWTEQPTFGGLTGLGSGGGGPTTPEGDPIYGYGWGLSG